MDAALGQCSLPAGPPDPGSPTDARGATDRFAIVTARIKEVEIAAKLVCVQTMWRFATALTACLAACGDNQLGPPEPSLDAGPWQTAIPAGTYFAAHVDGAEAVALVGCDVAPGFEFADFHLTTRSTLTLAYPHLGPVIARYTR